MDEEKSTEFYDWTFPEFEEENELVELPMLTNDENEISPLDEDRQNGIDQEELNEKANKDFYNEEVERLKNEYSKKIEVLDNLLGKLRNPTSIIDEEFIELIQDIIKKLAKKIIYKEISVDVQLLKQMINELKSLLDAKQGMITIYLSSYDSQRLQQEQENTLGLTNVDPTLSSGDVIIKSNFAEVRALLSERIEQLLRIQYE